MDDNQLLEALRGIIKEETANFATKDEIANFATKDEIANFATKDDLKELHTQQAELARSVRGVDMKLDNEFSKVRELLKEAYQPLADASKKVVDYDEVKDTVSEHDSALKSHNERISKLEQKAI